MRAGLDTFKAERLDERLRPLFSLLLSVVERVRWRRSFCGSDFSHLTCSHGELNLAVDKRLLGIGTSSTMERRLSFLSDIWN